jgi:Aspartyl protease
MMTSSQRTSKRLRFQLPYDIINPSPRNISRSWFYQSVKLTWLFAIVLFLALLLVNAAVATAKSYDAETVLKGIYNLSEFPDTTQAPRSYSIEGTANNAGLSGHFSTLYDRSEGYVTTLDLGFFSVSQGFDGADGWESNFNGIVSDITRLNEDLLVLARIIGGKEYLSASVEALERECLGPAEFQDRGGYYFRFSTPKGITGDAFIDSVTGDVVGLQMQYDFVEAEVVFSDFRENDGVSFAFHAELTANLAELNIVTQTTSCEVNFTPPDSAFSRPVTKTADVTFPADTDSIVAPLEYYEGHLYFRMSVNGSKPRLFMLDSGAGAHIIDDIHLESLGLKSVGVQPGLGVAGSAEFSFANVTEMNLAGIVFKNQKVGVLSLGPMLRDAFRGITGIVGYDFLAHFVVTVDYTRHQMTIYPPSRDLASGENSISAILPLEFFSNVPTVIARINRKPGVFLVDAGSNYGPLLHEYFVKANNLGDLPTREAIDDNGHIGGVGGSLPTKAVTIADFELSTLLIQDQPAWAILGSAGVAASKLLAGNIGNGFLEQFRVTFDYPHRRIILHEWDSD